MKSDVKTFVVSVQRDDIEDLNARLDRIRWPDQLPDSGWGLGADLGYIQDLCHTWRSGFDWNGFESRSNIHPQIVTTVDGQNIHAIHARADEPGAPALLLIHGWPGSIVEFRDVIAPLNHPDQRGGGDGGQSCSVVVPSLPGFGFSGPTTRTGWDVNRIADAFVELMDRLGYPRFVAQGGDWGSQVALAIASRHPEHVAGVHVNLLGVTPPAEEDPLQGLSDDELARLGAAQQFFSTETGYQAIQSTKPQTLAYGLTDSPSGLAGWIAEKFYAWSDCAGDLETVISRERLLDNISTYWITGTINSSMRLYYESIGPGNSYAPPDVSVPMAYSLYPAEIYSAPRRWAELHYNIVQWVEQPHGGHFAALEAPEIFVQDVQAFLGVLRQRGDL